MSWAIRQSGATVSTRRIAPSYQPWVPLPYMERGAEFLANRYSGGLPLRPGGRKTSITLEAFRRLKERGRAQTMLIIAPLRVCRQTWRQEAAKWEQFRDLKFSLLHGDKKDERLLEDADIWLINPEGVPWLCQRFLGRSLPFDIVCIDELTKFKNSQSERFKSLEPRLKNVKYRWGLTGSLSPNGHMDLFGMMKILDGGVALGRYITHYRDQYFQLGFDGFSYTLMPGAEARIVDKIAPYWFRMDDADYAQLPPEVPDPRMLELTPAARKIYDKMKKDMIAQLPDGIVTAANSAACYSKLSQMANGACYVGDDKEVATVLHDLKLDALTELADELDGSPMLVGYEFNHDLERIKEWHLERYKKPLPYLGKGTTVAQEDQYIREWNEGKLPILAAHPASAGHGLNMQGFSASDVCWFSIPWDYELYDQFIRRIRRDGTLALQIFNHLLIVRGTIDELKYAALGAKELTQTGLYRALNHVLLDTETQAAGGQPQQKETTMRLSRPGGAAAPAPQQEQTQQHTQQNTQQHTESATTAAPKGWGRAGAAGNGTQAQDTAGQREAIQERISPDANKSAFSQQTQELADRIQGGQEPAQEHSNGVRTDQPAADPAPRTRRRTATADAAPREDQKQAADANADALKAMLAEFASQAGNAYLRLKAVEIASQAHFAHNFESSDDLFAMADEVLGYINKPF